MNFLAAFAYLISYGSLNAAETNSPKVFGDRLRVATAQYQIDGNHSFSSLLEKLESMLKQAQKEKADLVVFPETLILDMWPLQSDKSGSGIVSHIAQKYSSEFVEKGKELSARYKMAILLGSIPRLTQENKIRNTSYLLLPDGKSFSQDKTHLTAWERDMGWEAGDKIQVFDAPWGKTSILICYDVEFPSVSHELTALAPELILVPSMTESASGQQRVRWTAQARAVEHHAFVVVSSTVGNPGPHWSHFGQSAIISPRDEFFKDDIVQKKPNVPDMIYGDVDFKKLRDSRKKSVFYPAKDQSETEH